MVHGEAERDCVDGDQPGLLGGLPHWHARIGRQPRWATEAGAEAVDGCPVPLGLDRCECAGGPVGSSRPEEPVDGPAGPDHGAALEGAAEPPPPTCQTDRPGWAGAHRHGPVRPRARATRRERPPRRWC